jgi:WD40 repeat protein
VKKPNWTLRQTLEGHSEKVNSVSFSPDGKTIASVAEDNTIKIWNTRDGKERKNIEGSSGSPISLFFSPDSKILVVIGGSSKAVHILNGIWQKELYIAYNESGSDFSFSPDDKTKTIAAITNDGVLLKSLELDKLLEQACNQARDYLKNNPNAEESDRHLCDGIGTQK